MNKLMGNLFSREIWAVLFLLAADTSGTRAQSLSASVRNTPQRAIAKTRFPHIAMKEFDLNAVKLHSGPFLTARDLNARYLLSLSADRLLHNFLLEAGLKPKAPRYEGWESRGIAGHTLGHYLSALAMQSRATGDTRFEARLDYVVAELARCQAKIGTGYVAGIPDGDKLWREIENGEVRASGFDLNGAWVPWYTLHKLFAGLRDAHQIGGNAEAKTVLLKLCDWSIDVTRNLDEAKWQNMLQCEHGGMNEVLADVFELTGEAKYLKLARKFDHKAVLNPLRAGEDRLAGLHGNTQIPKIIGLARLHELTGDEADGAAASFFWKRMVESRSYAIGGNSEHEHLSEAGHLGNHLGVSSCETCNTYNMLKLTRHLSTWTGDASYFDFYERALWNHILAAQDPQQGMFAYFVSLKPGHFKTYSTPEASFWCCVGSGLENYTKTNEAIYSHDDNSLFVNLFIASEVDWQDKGLKVRQETNFPQSGLSTLHISAPRAVRAALKVRVPAWSARTEFKINGKTQKVVAKPGTYAHFERIWKDGDSLEISLEMKLHAETTPDDPTKIALLHGPIVLAAQLGLEGVPLQRSDDQGDLFGVPTPEVPILVSSGDVLTHVKPMAGQSQTFQIEEIAHLPGQSAPTKVTLRPFYQTAFGRYTVYFDAFTPAQWEQKQAAYEAETARARDLAARTVDEYRPGEQQSEIDHAMKGESTRTGNSTERNWRDAANGGGFEFTLKVLPGETQDLWLTFWGGDSGGRDFEVLVDGHKVGDESLHAEKPDQFIDRSYPLSTELLAKKNRVTVRLQAKPGAIAGGIFGARIVRRENAL